MTVIYDSPQATSETAENTYMNMKLVKLTVLPALLTPVAVVAIMSSSSTHPASAGFATTSTTTSASTTLALPATTTTTAQIAETPVTNPAITKAALSTDTKAPAQDVATVASESKTTDTTTPGMPPEPTEYQGKIPDNEEANADADEHMQFGEDYNLPTTAVPGL